jgi:23S rRNA (uracil1939-C5)-methyltransferase
VNDVEEVRTERMATGGEAVARLADGRVVFVHGAVPAEVVRVQLISSKKRWARADLVEVVEPGPARAPLLCDHALSGECGGCDWLHVAPRDAQSFKVDIVTDQLLRLGKLEAPVVTHHPAAPGRRVTARCSVVDGRLGYRGRRSNDRFVAESCQALHPDLEALMLEGRFEGCDEVTLRLGAGTGERMAVIHGGASAAPLKVPEDVLVVDGNEPGTSTYATEVAGRTWLVSALSFFQTSDAGAETLVAAVRDALGDGEGPVLDLYAGGGLLGGGAAPERVVTAVESNAHAVRDARHNLSGVEVIEARVEQWTPTKTYATVIADPARAGLGTDGVAVVNAAGADELVLVSCDPASLGRDTGLLNEAGWRHDGSVVVDMFPDTSRIEVVTAFHRS